jgi:6-phosphofructokinase 1
MKEISSDDKYVIKTLGEPTVKSPLKLSSVKGDRVFNFIEDGNRVLKNISLNEVAKQCQNNITPLSFEKAGPKEKIFFRPTYTTAAIVTCGGLCPGINNVIRSIVMGLYYFYGVKRVLGIPYGYEGLNEEIGHGLIELNPEKVKDIQEFGGTMLGSSRGGQDVSVMVDTIEQNGIDMLFTIGGDGTLKGAAAIQEEIEKRGLNVSVIGVPKTIDNDINLIDQSFGFETAVDMASPIIRNAHNEAIGVHNGIAIVKLMGRDSGFIAATAAMAMQVVNFVLVPEMNFSLEGEKGFLTALQKRLESSHHAVIVVAEGAGQHLFDEEDKETDASGNVKYKDIGPFLKRKIEEYFKSQETKVTIKYIDPSYIIRSAPANSRDSIFCSRLGKYAVHGAMAGKTGFVVGMVNNKFVYLPIREVTSERKKVDLEGELWYGVLESTGQPALME